MADTMPCPFCAEQIAVGAKKCRFCNEWLDTFSGQLSYDGNKSRFRSPHSSRSGPAGSAARPNRT